MPNSCRLPITCATTGDNYVAEVQIGSAAVPASLIVDTGSSATAVNASLYDPSQDAQAVTGELAQNLTYLSGTMLGAVVQTSLTAAPPSGAPTTFPGTNVAVNYAPGANCFGAAQGILGLAYKPGDAAFTMPGNSWQNKYPKGQFPASSDQLLDPFLDQAAAAGALERAFAIAVKRSLASQADPRANSGILVLGADAADCADLYQAPLAFTAIIAGNHYNTSLVTVQVGGQPAIPVPTPPSWSSAVSNSMIDSGTSSLTLAQTLYTQVLASFNAVNPAYGTLLQSNAANSGANCDQTLIDLASWPSLTFALQGGAAVTVAPGDYWQFDAAGAGRAIAAMCGDGGQLGGLSILGLPLFAGNFVLFDRTGGEPGRIGFARLS